MTQQPAYRLAGIAALFPESVRLAYDFERTAQRVAAQLRAPAPEFRAFLERAVIHEQHQPRPLCIDGHAYRRRRNARRSRR